MILKKVFISLVSVFIVSQLAAIEVRAQPTAFTYQGSLGFNGSVASGSYDFAFSLYSSASGGTPIANTLSNLAVPVVNGLFTVPLDFGQGVFTGPDRWLEASVRTNSGSSFILLSPRQHITSAPYAVTAANLTGPVPGFGLSGTYSNAITFNNSLNSFAGNGAGLVNLNSASLASGTVPLARLSGITSNQMDSATDAAYRGATNVIHVFNVMDYGAKGDGVDDSAAIAAAIHEMTNTTGGTLYFPPGNYRDTNTHIFSPAGGYDGTFFYPYTIAGDGRGTSHWLAAINNATFISGNYCTLQIKDITITDIGTGTNTGFHILTDTGPMIWTDVQLRNWGGIGADMQGSAGGCLYGCAFEYCGIGLRVPGFCDGWTGDFRIDHNTKAGLDIGGLAPYYPHRGSSGGRWHVTGANNNIAVVVGDGGGQTISGYIENSTNCIVAIGHPPEFNDTDSLIKSVVIENMSYLLYNGPGQTQVLARIYAPADLITLRHLGGGGTNVVSTSPSYDSTPMIFEGVQSGTMVLFSDGTTIPGIDPPIFTTVNLSEQRFQGAKRYYYAGTDGSLSLAGNATLGGGLFITNNLSSGSMAGILSGIGSPLNVVNASVGSLYLRTDGSTGSTLYVKESGTGSTGWVPK